MDFDLRFEWDEEKERKNIIKHEVSFKTAMRVFRDSHRIDFYDSGQRPLHNNRICKWYSVNFNGGLHRKR